MAALKSEAEEKADMKICYFIGRLNPPHEGHISTLIKMITDANKNGAIALILLGSGPKGERTMKDPITFKLKKDFLQYKLPKELHFEIREMTAPVKDVTSWYQENLQKLKFLAEQAKITLTLNLFAMIKINNFYNNKDLLIKLSREKFNEICSEQPFYGQK